MSQGMTKSKVRMSRIVGVTSFGLRHSSLGFDSTFRFWDSSFNMSSLLPLIDSFGRLHNNLRISVTDLRLPIENRFHGVDLILGVSDSAARSPFHDRLRNWPDTGGRPARGLLSDPQGHRPQKRRPGPFLRGHEEERLVFHRGVF